MKMEQMGSAIIHSVMHREHVQRLHHRSRTVLVHKQG